MLLALTVPVLVAVREFIEAPTNLLDVTIKAYERGELPVNDDELANFTRVQEMEQCVGCTVVVVATVLSCLQEHRGAGWW